MTTLQATIDRAWEDRASLAPASAPTDVRDAVAHVIAELDAGRLRVAEKRDGLRITIGLRHAPESWRDYLYWNVELEDE